MKYNKKVEMYNALIEKNIDKGIKIKVLIKHILSVVLIASSFFWALEWYDWKLCLILFLLILGTNLNMASIKK